MPYNLNQRVFPDYLKVEMKVEVKPGKELGEALERWAEVARLCEANGLENILAEMSFNKTLDLEDTFKLVTTAPQIGWKKSYKLAIWLKDAESLVSMKFAETAMQNLGYSMKLFQNRRRALRWLRSEESA